MRMISKAERDSNFELLRILCIVGIVIMHTNGAYMKTCTGINLIWSELENSIFQAGVSIFVLISGYFGIKTTVKKVVRLELEILFYSVISAVISCLYAGDSWVTLIKAFLPISTGRYWFMTSYMILMLFASFINQAVEQLSKVNLQKLLLLMFLIFSVLPTFIYFHVMKDGGKGIANMLFLYLLGRYIKKYGKEHYNNVKLALILLTMLGLSFALNTASSFVTGGIGAHSPMSRDCTVFIVFEAVTIFLLFREWNFKSATVNKLSRHVVAIYMFENAVRIVLKKFVFNWFPYAEKPYLALIEIAVVIVVVAICMAVDTVRMGVLDSVENKLANMIDNLWNRIYGAKDFLFFGKSSV